MAVVIWLNEVSFELDASCDLQLLEIFEGILYFLSIFDLP